ncbi:MAG: MFS transporter [Betaproteobacteria bacterium]|nr:MAG: MFS transporter [Betaproteobacteria bacterium]
MSPMVRLAAFYFVYFCHLGAFVAYFSLWLEARGHAPAEIAAALAAAQFVRIVAPGAWGWLADVWSARIPGGRRGLVALSSLCAALCLALLPLAASLQAVFAVVALTALFTSGILPLVEATTLGVLGARIERYGPVRVWGSVGFIVSVLAVGSLLDRQPVAVLVPIIAAWMLLAALSALALPRARAAPAERGAPGLRRVLREPRVAALFAACFCMSVAHGALYVFYSIHLVGAGYSKTVVGLLWTLGVVAEIVLFLALPILFRRYSLRALLLASFAAAAVRFVAIGWGVGSLALLAAAQLLHALTFGAYHSAAVAAVHRLFTGALAVRGQALYASLSYGLGGAAGMLLAGWSWSALGPAATFGLSGAFGVAGALLVAWKVRL